MNDTSKLYKVKVGEFVFSFSADDIKAMDIITKKEGEYHIIRQGQSTYATLKSSNETAKKTSFEVAGESFDIAIKDELDQMLEIMGFGMASAKQIKEIKAPMPGLVLEISVVDGQEIKEGNRLLILEAMKMENSIMIQRDATVKTVKVKAGQAVEKGQVLVELE